MFLVYALNFIMLKGLYEMSTNSCFLVYSLNFIKLSWTAAFKDTHNEKAP